MSEGAATWFRAEVRKESGVIVQQLGWFHNVITDDGLDGWVDHPVVNGYYALTRHCVVGTSSTSPSTSDTALGNVVASTYNTIDTKSSHQKTDPIYEAYTQTFEFNKGQAEGNLTEVGLRHNDGRLWNRQLFRDSNGNAVTVTVQSDEYLRIIAETRVYSDISSPSGTTTGSVSINGTTYNYTRTVVEQSWDQLYPFQEQKLDPDDCYISEDADGYDKYRADSVNPHGYTSGSFSLSQDLFFKASTFSKEVKTLFYGYDYGDPLYKITFDTAIPVTDQEELTLTLTRTWGRK